MKDCVLSIDPGREKCGVAVVGKDSGVIWKEVVSTSSLASIVTDLVAMHDVQTIVVGDRTSYRSAVNIISSLGDTSLDIVAVDEHHSSEEARSRYWREHPPSGLLRLVPLGLQVPPVPVDDYVAVILAERYFQKIQN